MTDFAALHQQWAAAGREHAGVVFTHPRRFPRSGKRHVQWPADALAGFADDRGHDVESFLWWLEPPSR